MDPRPWFRCPFGDGHDDARVLGALEELGYRNVHWHVETEDWEPWRTAAEIGNDTVAARRSTGTARWCCSTRGRARRRTPCRSIVEGFERAGASFATVDELEALP